MPLRSPLALLPSSPAGLAWLGGSSRVAGGPAFLTIETVNACNIACVYCPQREGPEHFARGRSPGCREAASSKPVRTCCIIEIDVFE